MFSPKEIAYIFRISYKTVMRLIKKGELIAYKVGRHYKITQKHLEEYLETHKNL